MASVSGKADLSTFEHDQERQQKDQHVFYRERAKDFVELHDQVESSVNLLDSLEAFLSTFQKDLSAVSGQIFELQGKSKDIENRLETRKRIEKPLSKLIADIVISPALATIILDSPVSESWIPAVEDFEHKLNTLNARSRVKAARDLGDLTEGLQIVAVTKLRAFFLVLIQPIQSNVTTNMQVIQTSVLMKYAALFGFLQRHAPAVAQEVQRTYIIAARTYYETGFRRYIRSLGWIKARSVEKPELITSTSVGGEPVPDFDRLGLAKIQGPGVTLAFQADDKNHKEPLEALFRSLFLVLMDNTTAEYKFISGFFGPGQTMTTTPTTPRTVDSTPETTIQSPLHTSESTHKGDKRRGILTKEQHTAATLKAERATLDSIWKQIVDPVLDYTQTFVQSVLDPSPPLIPLLTMIRLSEDVVAEIQMRGCVPLESFVFGIRLQMWPVFQKSMTENLNALKKLADGGGGGSGLFASRSSISETHIVNICKRYTVLFNAFVALTEQAEETMIFSNLLRLRQELMKLVIKYANQSLDPVAQASTQSSLCETILQGLSQGSPALGLPKSQKEKAYWAEKEEEARRRIVSATSRGRR